MHVSCTKKEEQSEDASLVGGSTVPDHGGRLRVSFDLVNRTALSWIYILPCVPFPHCMHFVVAVRKKENEDTEPTKGEDSYMHAYIFIENAQIISTKKS